MYITENFVSSLYLLIQSSTLKKCIEHCLMALATSNVYIYIPRKEYHHNIDRTDTKRTLGTECENGSPLKKGDFLAIKTKYRTTTRS